MGVGYCSTVESTRGRSRVDRAYDGTPGVRFRLVSQKRPTGKTCPHNTIPFFSAKHKVKDYVRIVLAAQGHFPAYNHTLSASQRLATL